MAGTEKMTQCEKILQYMTENGCITPFEALREFGCMRLASRISDLRKAGHSIHKEMATAKNKNGESVWFAVYKLVK